MNFVAGMEKIRMIFSEDAHTFGYEGKHYDVNYLIDYITHNKDIVAKPIKNPIDRIIDTNVQNTWGSLKSNKGSDPTPQPITFKNLLSHIDRVNRSNYQKYPIVILMEFNPDKMRILDGVHRILKAELDGKSMIPAYSLTTENMVEFTSKYSSSAKWS